MWRDVVVVLAIGCGSTSAPVATPAPPDPQFVVEVGKSLRWYTIDRGSLPQTRELALPSKIRELLWSHHQPVLDLEDNRIAVAGDQLEFLAVPPPDVFKRPEPIDGAVHLDSFESRVFTKGDEIWLRRCEWAVEGLYTVCVYWVSVRLRPAPAERVEEEINDLFDIQIDKPAVAAAPSPSIKATLVPDKERHAGARDKLVCVDGATTTEDPIAGTPLDDQFDNNTEGGRSDLVWLSTTPAIFQVTDWDNCRPCPTVAIFERCQRSKRFTWAQFGPDGLIAFTTDDPGRQTKNYVLFQGGREIGTVEHVSHFGFVR